MTSSFADHIHAMGQDKARIRQVRFRLEQIYSEVQRAESLKAACSNGKDVNSVCMRIRHLHNELGCHVNELSKGALYRSKGVLEAEKSGLLTSRVVHQEHTIPAHVIAGMLWTNFRDAPVEDMAEFLLRSSVVTAVARNMPVIAELDYVVEGGRGGCLEITRSYPGHRPKKWKHHHPEYHHESKPGVLTSRPFLRYEGTGIRIFSVVDGTEVSLNSFTLADHHRYVAQFALYNPETYFPARMDFTSTELRVEPSTMLRKEVTRKSPPPPGDLVVH